MKNFRNKMANQHNFAMIQRPDVPRSRYMLPQNRKQAFNGGDLVPIYCEEILPGDHFAGKTSIYARFATPIAPVLDNAILETFFFFVPNRLVWENWEAFITGQDYTVPTLDNYGNSGADYVINGIYDHFGLPTIGQLTTPMDEIINALPLRAYNLIYNEWFRDQNLTTELPTPTDDGPDNTALYSLQKRAKKPDYFTTALPWAQKGDAVDLPLGTSAIVKTTSADVFTGGAEPLHFLNATTGGTLPQDNGFGIGADGKSMGTVAGGHATSVGVYPSNLYADLSAATAATINQIRQAFQIQKLLERDARGGTRYKEVILAHFGINALDFRLERPEYIGGGRTAVNTLPIAQTSASNLTGGSTPLGNLSAVTTAHSNDHTFKYAATEHGYIIGLANVRTDLTYQQGIRRHWLNQTRYDYYWPAFAHLGEQTITSREIYCTGAAEDANAFGYQERYAHLRYTPNEITGLFRSTAANTIDLWHYGEKFTSRPSLNNTFITDPSQTTLARSMAVGTSSYSQQILADILHQVVATRPIPTHSTPGLVDHF